jgi:dihydrofolate synthase/folylpolyglutamate synthase
MAGETSVAPHLASLLAALLARGQRGMALGLDRVEDALRALGDPHLAAPAIVVAGTNGKGSVCAMVESIARVAGVRAGMTTSPHLIRFAERIRVDGRPLTDEAFEGALQRVLRDARDDLTFFETLTCAAFVAFAEAKVELAVLEVGLGGRLDATNVVPHPLATAVVTIAEGDDEERHLEHAAILGGTVEAIAREKAGIFRRGVPAVIGRLRPRARATVLEVAREVGVSEVLEVVREEEPAGTTPVHVSGWGRMFVEIPGRFRVGTRPGLRGFHQFDNAAVAAALAWCAGEALPRMRDESNIGHGLLTVDWPGRMEWIREPGVDPPQVLLDAAHNLDGARALARAMHDVACGRWGAAAEGPRRTVLVFGALADKAFEALLRELAPLAERRVYTSPQGRAPAPLDALTAIAPGETIEDPARAVERARQLAAPGDVVLVAGSIYLVGAVRAHLLGEERDPAIAL